VEPSLNLAHCASQVVLGCLIASITRVATPGAFSVNPLRRNSVMASVAASYNVLANTSTV